MQRFLMMTVAPSPASFALSTAALPKRKCLAQEILAGRFNHSRVPVGQLFGGPLRPHPAWHAEFTTGGGAGGSTRDRGGVSGSLATGTARFQRENRSTADFVGKSGINDPAALLNRGTAAAEVVERRVPEVLLNPPRTPASRTRMYEPRLSVGFPLASRPEVEVSANLDQQVANLTQRDPALRVTATVEGRTARLQGTVSSQSDREMLEQLILFEPGISSVQNDLQVLSAAP